MLETVLGTMVSQDRAILVLTEFTVPWGTEEYNTDQTIEQCKIVTVISTRKERFMVLREIMMGFFLIREVRESTLELVSKNEERWQKHSGQWEQFVQRPCAGLGGAQSPKKLKGPSV